MVYPSTCRFLHDILKVYWDLFQVTTIAHFTNDFRLGSLDSVQIVMTLEKEFGFEIPDNEADKINSSSEKIEEYQSISIMLLPQEIVARGAGVLTSKLLVLSILLVKSLSLLLFVVSVNSVDHVLSVLLTENLVLK
ncbi:hypothetical protein ACH5RR_026398 [Cinchona calisaya]|uniref:Carrier domain-containing protein n=1 Tax=Cinchona calisaya TaxID=153742 RepID=A0ABD2Z2G7_9GENT